MLNQSNGAAYRVFIPPHKCVHMRTYNRLGYIESNNNKNNKKKQKL